MITLRSLAFVACVALIVPGARAAMDAADSATFRDIYRELVEIRTVHPDGDNTAVARAVQARLVAAGLDPKEVRIYEPAPRKGNLVARYRGTGEMKPLLLLAHIDVVEAKKEDWSDGLDPFKLTQKDGYYYGRGTLDDKAMAAAFVAAVIRFKREDFRPKRDIILALTADEEGGTHNGVAWLIQNEPAALEAEIALNEGGEAEARGGKPYMLGVQVSEKLPRNYVLEVANAGGHSSLPRRDNAIYELARALDRIDRLEFPVRLNDVSRGLAATRARVETGELAAALRAVAAGNPSASDIAVVSAVPEYNAQLRTTCVATMVSAGHAANALPQSARATVNCRIIPGETPEEIERALARAAGDGVSVKMNRSTFGGGSPADSRSPVMTTIRRVAAEMWPGIVVVPTMSTGATDGSRLRNAGVSVYGADGIFVEFGENRIHGRDERVGVQALHDGAEFLYRLAKALASGE